jgi:hypothetical protein
MNSAYSDRMREQLVSPRHHVNKTIGIKSFSLAELQEAWKKAALKGKPQK